MSEKNEVNQEELAKVFTEWERRYREEPERFQSEAVKLLRETPESYGEAAAPYFIFILNEMRANIACTGLAPAVAPESNVVSGASQ